VGWQRKACPTLSLGVAALWLMAAAPMRVLAGNGLNLIGFGTESVAMGGADIAVARDTTALNTNPAGLARLARARLDGYNAVAVALDVGHRDGLGNDVRVDNRFIPLGGGGYAKPLGRGVTVGFGLFAQGGAGNVYKNVHTGYGNNDELSALFGILKLSAGAAWKLADGLAVGIAGSVLYSRIDQQVFPDTSVAGTSPFFGLTLKGVHGVNGAVRAGLLVTPDARWTLAATFAPKSTLTMDRGRAIVNMTAAGLGNVVYHDVRASGLALPREVALGIAWQATPRTLIASKLAWLEWSRAMRQSTLTLRSPETTAAPQLIQTVAPLDWRNQFVLALGIAHAVDDANTLRAGFNFGRSPARAATMNPLLATIGERHFTAGASHRFNGDWEVAAAVEYLPTARIDYTNPLAPLGVDAEERTHYIAVHGMLSHQW
jgi:long-chain fatty acid transport protein